MGIVCKAGGHSKKVILSSNSGASLDGIHPGFSQADPRMEKQVWCCVEFGWFVRVWRVAMYAHTYTVTHKET